ncbi:Outer membrane protein (porin) [Variovorax sp. YR266]|uniref:porin n=1 Tax=Variovorax sp. YR266 TaxID=1884386 RepID=UPI00089ABA10|nr:porin [Variovorax sp. YR266]SDZ70808.1 Outer membrane protein (porin) [Variovorax sp. YR266]
MKRIPTALALFAVAGVTFAQSSVTLFGVVDASVSYYAANSRNPVSGVPSKQSQTVLANSAYNSSRLGFRGTEDLGGGLAASFWLEASIKNDDGSQGISAFQRRSTVSLSGSFGEIRLGRDYTPTFWNDAAFDPLGIVGVGQNVIASVNGRLSNSLTDTYARASNSVGYFLPASLNGFYGQVQYSLPENTKVDGVADSRSAKGRYTGSRFGYLNGPLDVALAYGESITADIVTNRRKIQSLSFGASYDFGVAKLFGEISQVKDRNATLVPASGFLEATDTYNGYLVGTTVPIGPGLIRVSYSHVKSKSNLPTTAAFNDVHEAEVNKIALGYVHNLSKRTALYATVARLNIRNGQNNAAIAGVTTGGAPGYIGVARNATGYDFGIRHAF